MPERSHPERIHIVGVGGPGTSAIAIILHEMGHRVSGSDVRESPTLQQLRDIGVSINVPHDARAIEGCDIVTHSAAVRSNNLELVAARATGVEVLTRAAMLGRIATQAPTVAVAGTHGKTTTTTLLTLMLRAAGRDPGFLIGAEVPQLPRSAHWGTGHFVIEADESDSSHRAIKPWATILTNVDLDHLDEHGSFDGIIESFDAYLAEVPGPKVVCTDDPVAATLADTYGAVTYGVGAGNWSADSTAARGTTPTSDGSTPTPSGKDPTPDVWAADIVHHADGTTFEVCEGAARHRAVLPLRGLHNVRNLLAAFAMARQLGVDATVALDAVKQFSGVRRRFEVRAHDGGATFVDDYAHLPAEIAAVLASVRAGGTQWKRVLAVFQPNRFNRMAVMSDAYSDAFIDADVIAITDIYASGTDRIDGVSGRLVVDAVRRAHPHARVEWCQERESLIDFVAREARAGDVCISMGCGDIETFPDEVVARRRDLSRGS